MSKPYRFWGRIWAAVLLIILPGDRFSTADDPPPLAVKKPGQQDFKGAWIYGTVTRLDQDGFMVAGCVNQPVAPKRYKGELNLQLSADLRVGRFNPGESAGGSYLPGDLRVGDGVMINFNRLGGVDVCTSICIRKRPGGRVPPSPNAEANKRYEKAFGYKYHEYANAQQDWEERGIPLPEKFKPRATPPFPSSSGAPSPPQVKPKPPAKP